VAHYDVLIIGAGINGCGLFRDLCLQGVSCLLIDRGDICEGASAASSRLIHGGIKYLETGEFRLVRESAMERNRLLRNAPHVVKPLEVILPVHSWFGGIIASALRFAGLKVKLNDRGAFITEAGLRLYDAYSRKIQALPDHRFLGPRQMRTEYPSFARQIKAAGLYHEGHITHAERLGLELVQDGLAANASSALKTYTTVKQRAGDRQIILQESLSGETETVTCSAIVNAGGAWIDKVNAVLGINAQRMGGTKGSHLIVDNPQLLEALKGRMIYFGTADGRVNLMYPYFGHVLVGSTDIPVKDPDEAICSESEKTYLLNCISEVFPNIQVSANDVGLTYCGVRPLPRSDAANAGDITRDHSIARDKLPGSDIPVFSLIGGKWTTFRAFAAQAADMILPLLGKKRLVSTEDRAIGGGRNYPTPALADAYVQSLARNEKLDAARAKILFSRYGTSAAHYAESCREGGAAALASLPDYSRGEIIHMCRHERVHRLSDILLRRTTVAMEGLIDANVVAEVASIAAAEFRWSATRRASEIAHTRAELKRRSLDLEHIKTAAA
jgi:glycerol-3-phosphate dehydrogenase